ncbi:motility associated factor glycosyltransferase family protein [Paenibacillus sp. LjRoot56]|uniref:motility associated factor glycosyltransferase family protein n=1 Tax=Paenibacillus sp. LjRoot56 TaxID=3342333 RepID=UPI003ECDD9E1
MILIDNVQFLRQRYAQLWGNVSQLDKVISNMPYEVSTTKSGLSNLQVTKEGKAQYIHSQYDPFKEAERFIDQFLPDEVEEFEHIFFYGVGMGYHIEQFMERYPDRNFSLYEPDAFLFYHYLSQRNLDVLPLHRLKNIFVEFTPEFLHHSLNEFVNGAKERVMLVVLPSYERIYKEQYERFTTEFRNMVLNKRSSLQVNIAFEKRWTINSIANLPYLMESANIIQSKKSYFHNKPVLLVSAGPSLQEEIEHIRHVKEQGLAYIFAVGSSIKALLAQGIYPDAVCSYDPQHNTVETYYQIIEEKIESIPLIYGTSVGFETVHNYPGPKLHMVTSQDKVAPLYISNKDKKELEYVEDAPSIAVVTLELLHKLGASPIILVGQNFAYKNNQFYASGIDYQTPSQQRPTDLSEQEIKNAIMVDGVDGSPVYTSIGFNSMRLQMESYTAKFAGREIINTTQGGAKIANTTFASLQQLVEERLTQTVVESDWYQTQKEDVGYDLIHMLEQCKVIEVEQNQLLDRLQRMGQLLHEMKQLLEHKNEQQLVKVYPVFDKEFKKMKKNKIFDAILLPMNRVEHEILGRNIAEIRFEPNVLLKTKKIIDMFGHFLFRCQQEVTILQPVIQESHEKMKKKAQEVAVS